MAAGAGGGFDCDRPDGPSRTAAPPPGACAPTDRGIGWTESRTSPTRRAGGFVRRYPLAAPARVRSSAPRRRRDREGRASVSTPVGYPAAMRPSSLLVAVLLLPGIMLIPSPVVAGAAGARRDRVDDVHYRAVPVGRSAPLTRAVRMYWSRKDPEKNLRFVRQNGGTPVADYITGVILCCNDPKIDYTAGASGFSGTNISGLVEQYRQHNLTVHVCAKLQPASMSAAGVDAARAAIPALVRWAADQRIDGVIVDYEPSKNYTADHVAAYASFLHELSSGMHENSMESACDLASWGILDKYSAFAPTHTALDFVTTMESWYRGRNISALRQDTEEILAAGFSPGAVHLGVSNQCKDPPTCDWTTEKMVEWLHYLEQRQLRGVDVWAPDDPQNTPRWMFQAFKGFLAGFQQPVG